jgi:aminoglycoside phosphotransferase (APT) family kinase protein
MSSENALPPEIESWIERVGGGRLLKADRVDSGDPYSTLREADVYRALQDTAIPVPRIYGVHEKPQAVLSERARGETWFSRIRDPDEQLAVARDFIRHLAALHRIEPRTLDIPALGPLAPARELVLRELDAWQTLYERHESPTDPLIEFALGWLRRNVPDYEGPVVLVQGDTGPGNFLYADRKVQAILDWELAHWGDPMDDIAWLSLRAVQEPFTPFPDRLRDYAELSGHPIDEGRVRYHRVFAELRIVTMGHGRAEVRSSKGEIGNQIIYGALHHRLLVETLADVLGVVLEPPELPEAEPTDREWLYDAALDQIRDVLVPRSSDPFVILRAKGLARVLKHLRDTDRLARDFDAQELSDLEALLDARPASIAAGRDALTLRVRKGDLSDEEIVRYFHRSAMRRTELARSASGALADRHYPPLA